MPTAIRNGKIRWIPAFFEAWSFPFLLIVFFLTLGASAHADPITVVADHAVSGDEIALKDGRILRLTGIKAIAPEARDFLQALIAGQGLVLENISGDRYNRVAATASVDGHGIEDSLLRAGMAFVYPAAGDEAQLDAWLREEKEARAAGRGWWADHADVSSDDAERLYGSYGFVSGTVVKAERVKNKVYLNFGADWRTDFTIAIMAHDLRAFKNQDLDPLSWQGKRLRVRGWVKRDFGPMITVTDPHQIELL